MKAGTQQQLAAGIRLAAKDRELLGIDPLSVEEVRRAHADLCYEVLENVINVRNRRKAWNVRIFQKTPGPHLQEVFTTVEAIRIAVEEHGGQSKRSCSLEFGDDFYDKRTRNRFMRSLEDEAPE